MPILSSAHLTDLEASAIDATIIAERGYRTIAGPDELPTAFADWQRRPGLLVPIRDTTGNVATYQLKASDPRRGKDGKSIKYDTAADARQCIDVPQRSRPHLGNPGVPLWITEGAKKVDSGLSHGIRCIIGVQGVYGWRGCNEHCGTVALPDWESIALNGRSVVIAFDSDCMTKASVRDALHRLGAFLTQRKATVRYLVLPDHEDNGQVDSGQITTAKKCGLDDAFAQGMTLAAMDHRIVDHLPDLTSEWETPITFDDPVGPPFPIDALPHQLSNYVSAVALDTGAPVDLVAWCALATIGAATRGRFVMSPKATWREPVHIQSMQIVASGGGKSPAYNAVTAPLKAWDADQAAEGRKALGEWTLKGKRLAAQEKQAQREADKSGLGQADKRLTLEAVQRHIIAHDQERPYAKHIVVNDITPQAVWKFLHRQEGSGAAFSAEGEFFRNVNRYGDAPVWEPVLKGFSGDGHETRRAGDEDDDGRLIPRPIFALSLALQPQVVEDLGQMRGFRELGVLARLLMAFPRPVPERSSLSTAVPCDRQEWWSERILEIANWTEGSTVAPKALTMSDDALALFRKEYAWYPQAVADGVFLDMEEWGRKYRGQVLRIAGILHILEAEDPVKANVSAENMRRAITVMRNAIEHARIGHGIILGLGAQSHERYLLGIIDTLLDGNPTAPITSADIYDRVRGRYVFRKADHVTTILQTLEEHRYIRLVRRDGPGPRTSTIYRNPKGDTCEDAKLPPPPVLRTPETCQETGTSHLRRHPPSPETRGSKHIEPTPIRPEPLSPTGTDDDWEVI